MHREGCRTHGRGWSALPMHLGLQKESHLLWSMITAVQIITFWFPRWTWKHSILFQTHPKWFKNFEYTKKNKIHLPLTQDQTKHYIQPRRKKITYYFKCVFLVTFVTLPSARYKNICDRSEAASFEGLTNQHCKYIASFRRIDTGPRQHREDRQEV